MLFTTTPSQHLIVKYVCLVVMVTIVFLMLDTSISRAQTATEIERISRLEGAYEHLATKDDVARLETQVLIMRAEIDSARWFVTLITSIVAIVVSAVISWFSSKR